VLSAEHRCDVRLQAAGIGPVEQQRERFVGDALPGVIQVQTRCLGDVALSAEGIGREQLAQVARSRHLRMLS
jgi:hypothetical protein